MAPPKETEKAHGIKRNKGHKASIETTILKIIGYLKKAILL